jgi:hypothetical protein
LRRNYNTTILIVSHNHATILPLCDYMLKLTTAGLERNELSTNPAEHKVITTHDLDYSTP